MSIVKKIEAIFGPICVRATPTPSTALLKEGVPWSRVTHVTCCPVWIQEDAVAEMGYFQFGTTHPEDMFFGAYGGTGSAAHSGTPIPKEAIHTLLETGVTQVICEPSSDGKLSGKLTLSLLQPIIRNVFQRGAKSGALQALTMAIEPHIDIPIAGFAGSAGTDERITHYRLLAPVSAIKLSIMDVDVSQGYQTAKELDIPIESLREILDKVLTSKPLYIDAQSKPVQDAFAAALGSTAIHTIIREVTPAISLASTSIGKDLLKKELDAMQKDPAWGVLHHMPGLLNTTQELEYIQQKICAGMGISKEMLEGNKYADAKYRSRAKFMDFSMPPAQRDRAIMMLSDDRKSESITITARTSALPPLSWPADSASPPYEATVYTDKVTHLPTLKLSDLHTVPNDCMAFREWLESCLEMGCSEVKRLGGKLGKIACDQTTIEHLRKFLLTIKSSPVNVGEVQWRGIPLTNKYCVKPWEVLFIPVDRKNINVNTYQSISDGKEGAHFDRDMNLVYVRLPAYKPDESPNALKSNGMLLDRWMGWALELCTRDHQSVDTLVGTPATIQMAKAALGAYYGEAYTRDHWGNIPFKEILTGIIQNDVLVFFGPETCDRLAQARKQASAASFRIAYGSEPSNFPTEAADRYAHQMAETIDAQALPNIRKVIDKEFGPTLKALSAMTESTPDQSFQLSDACKEMCKTPDGRKTLAECMVAPIRCGGWDYGHPALRDFFGKLVQEGLAYLEEGPDMTTTGRISGAFVRVTLPELRATDKVGKVTTYTPKYTFRPDQNYRLVGTERTPSLTTETDMETLYKMLRGDTETCKIGGVLYRRVLSLHWDID